MVLEKPAKPEAEINKLKQGPKDCKRLKRNQRRPACWQYLVAAQKNEDEQQKKKRDYPFL